MNERSSETDNLKDPQDEAFLQVLANRTMLKAYILSIVKDPHLAEDTLSDATLVIVRAWDRFDSSRPFAPWARGVARRVALSNLRKHKKQEVVLDEDILEALGAEFSELGDEAALEESKSRLRECLDKLPERSRSLVDMRYFEEKPYEAISKKTGRTLSALYMAFSRIHDLLGRCLKRTLKLA